ncbi:MAG TPA: T9SS type A sorting domain-containing protein [Bacteroidia bacterium]|nr:T9SS type A sorting domain-containing protein [Bacteroidia bacterium]
MNSRFVILFLVCLNYNTFGQITTFERSYDTLGCYYSNSIVEYLDGYVLCGSSYNTASAQDAAIVRIDSLGNVIWVKQYGTPSTDGALKCVTTSDSCLLIVGIKEEYSTTDGKLWILKLNQFGDTLWTKSHKINTGRTVPKDIQPCKSGGFIISGFCSTQMNPDAIAMLIKIDSYGNLLWSKFYNTQTLSAIHSCIEIITGGYVCTGEVGVSSQTDIFITRTDSLGDTLWTKTLGNTNVDFGASVIQSQDSNIVIAGSTYHPSLNNWDMDLYKLSLNGGIIWHKTLGDNRENSAHTILQLSDGNYLIGGTTNTISNGYQGLLIKVDSFGDTLWVRTFGTVNSEIGYDVIESSDGGIVFTGRSDVFVPNPHTAMYCIKLDNLGQFNTHITDLLNEEFYILYPNPVNDFIRITTTKPSSRRLFITIIDGIGRICKTSLFINNTMIELDVTQFSKGIYLLLIQQDGETIIKKFIKQ